MPVYEYKCVDCDERFEVEQSIKDATLKTIKGDDHTHKVKKVFSPVGISFKGSGFYKNDSASSKKKDSPKPSTSESSSSESKDSPTSESKSASTSSSSGSESKKTKSDAKAAST
jgi:putative FmdB family regulatory protein